MSDNRLKQKQPLPAQQHQPQRGLKIKYPNWIKKESTKTWMESDAKIDSFFGQMIDPECRNCVHKPKRHFGDLIDMFVAISMWQPRNYQVTVTDGFYKKREEKFWTSQKKTTTNQLCRHQKSQWCCPAKCTSRWVCSQLAMAYISKPM